MKLKAIVLWQPWASLIAVGAKPLEFRGWSYVARKIGVKPGDRIAIAAGARPVKEQEVRDLLARLDDDLNTTGLVAVPARLLLQTWLRYSALIPKRGHMPDSLRERLREIGGNPCPPSVLVCTATIGEPKPSIELMPKWAEFINDSDRLEHAKWGWPMLDVRPIDGEPIASKGAQGFFWVNVPDQVAA